MSLPKESSQTTRIVTVIFSKKPDCDGSHEMVTAYAMNRKEKKKPSQRT
jgi:hypothetical protein